jgi:hypothetical protein
MVMTQMFEKSISVNVVGVSQIPTFSCDTIIIQNGICDGKIMATVILNVGILDWRS